jgi:hypothetical protein
VNACTHSVHPAEIGINCLNILGFASGGSILIRPIKKLMERSDFHKYSIFNIHYSILACPDIITKIGLLKAKKAGIPNHSNE